MNVSVVDNKVQCAVFALCDNEAVGVIEHPILEFVPSCQRCADRSGKELLTAEFLMTEQIEYTISVPGFNLWATGNIRGSANRVFRITEDKTLLGGMRAINAACDLADKSRGWVRAEDYSPTCEPNGALLGWEVGS